MYRPVGGTDVEGTQSVITTLPFSTEYKLNPTLKKVVKAVGGIDKVDTTRSHPGSPPCCSRTPS
jgi:hypothetical protein